MTEKINKPTKEEPEQQEKPVNNIEPQQEYIEIGDLKLASSVYPVNVLCDLSIGLLKDPVIKKYLMEKKNGQAIKKFLSYLQ
jgi:hypothetical protein